MSRSLIPRRNDKTSRFLALFGALLLLGMSENLCAQDGLIVDGERILSAEGAGKEVDKQHRGPNVTVGVQATETTTKILVAGKVLNENYQHFPIRYQFFINRQLFHTQVSSPELPGPIGVDIGTDIATIPFNYTIVAEVLHPNRRFTTVAQGAVTQSDVIVTPTAEVISNVLDQCTLVLNSGEDNESTFSASQVVLKRSGTDLTAAFTATNSESSEADSSASGSSDVQIRLSLQATDSSLDNQLVRDVDGTLIYVADDAVTSLAVEGSFSLSNKETTSDAGRPLSEFSVTELSLSSSEDLGVELECGSLQTQALKALASEIAK
jgi:hypothetical protein